MEEAKISSKGQIVIPKQLRDQMGLKPGKTVMINRIDGELIIVAKPSDPVKALLELGRELKMGDMRKEIKESRKERKRDAMY
ncbi:MAG: AbrB/MazE/SpoVT family DNA-binding domain-containing protein [Candidatus Aenigmarchaeota archaeon]|nr:AbrB/MazE/SpoVT family DNA-binding domain-containing protein [Candidatus Aenigmarchaeota archaeon]